MNRIGERMREYRRSIKMTQADFASRLGVTGAAVSAYETGNRLPSYEVLVKIANILGVSTDALLGRQSADRVVAGRHLPHPPAAEPDPGHGGGVCRREPAGGCPVMWVYQGLDILGTLLEAMGLYVLVNAFCPHREPSWRYLVPPAVFFVSVYLWTWFWEDSAYKIAVTLLLTFLAYKGLTKQPAMAILAGMMTQQIYLAAANALAETAAFFLLDEMTVVVEGQQFLRPVVYGLYFLFQIAFMLFFRFFLRKYAGGLDKRSVLAIALPFLLIEVLVHLLTVPFHNGQLGWFNVYWELGILLIAMLFLVLLVYIKNNLFLREQEQRSKLQIAHLQQQFAYYQDKQKEEERVHALYHDLKNHLLVLEQQPSTEAARQMAETLRGQIAAYEDYVHTGNEFFGHHPQGQGSQSPGEGDRLLRPGGPARERFPGPPGPEHPLRQCPGQRHRGQRKAAGGPAAHHPAGKAHPGHAPGHRGEPGPARIHPRPGHL